MAASQFIAPFPPDQDPDAFGHWLAGFTAGEGSFILSWRKGRKSARRRTGAAKFVVSLRDDDREILETIRSFLQCGTIHARLCGDDNPQSRLSISSVEELTEVVIPFFERFPLRAKKANDFPIWRRGVELIHRVSSRPMATGGRRGFRTKWTAQDIAEFEVIASHLNGQRKYDGSDVPPPLPRREPASDRFGFLFDLDN